MVEDERDEADEGDTDDFLRVSFSVLGEGGDKHGATEALVEGIRARERGRWRGCGV